MPEEDDEGQIDSGCQNGASGLPVGGQISSSTLNATPMKPKPATATVK
jgi:hypothetical protein